MSTSVLSPPGSGHPVLTDAALRDRLEVIRGQLLELEHSAPPEFGLGVALDVLEVTLTSLGWHYPPLTPHDREFLAAVGAL